VEEAAVVLVKVAVAVQVDIDLVHVMQSNHVQLIKLP
jgi:hypothetical protein